MKFFDNIESKIRRLLKKTGNAGDFTLEQLTGGRNNRVYKVCTNDKKFVVKAYYPAENKSHNRLTKEFNFVKFAWDNGLRQVPEPMGCNQDHCVALYGFLPGRKLNKTELNRDCLEQAIGFSEQLNRFKETPQAGILPVASEACLSFDTHFSNVAKRIQRWKVMASIDKITQQARAFVTTILAGSLEKEKKRVLSDPALGADTTYLCQSLKNRILSPSDFGFHNALVDNHGQIRFFDFEYAGWDSPVKMICDFFCQPDIPVVLDHLEWFVNSLTVTVADYRQRKNVLLLCRVLMPIYRIKWCCIMLNDFLEAESQRRRFSSLNQDNRRTQLKKTIAYAKQHDLVA